MRLRNLAAFLVFATFIAACGPQQPAIKTVPEAESIQAQPTGQTPRPTASLALTPGATQKDQPGSVLAMSGPVLEWQGLASSGESDPGGCKIFQVISVPESGNSGEIAFGSCGQGLKSAPYNRTEIGEMVNRLASFELKSQQESLIFRGKGEISSPAWHRAVLHWAETAYAENATGRVCAACESLMSWYLSSAAGQDGMCRHLNVLTFGLAYAEVLPCSGGEVQSSRQGWVDSGNWEQLDEWSVEKSRVDIGDNYFDGKGSQPMSPDEQAALEEIAKSIFQQISQ